MNPKIEKLIKKIDLRDKATSQGFKFLLRDTTYYVKLTAEIGDSVGKIFGRDHATVISSYEKVSKRLNDPMFNVEIKSIISEVTGR